jgi:serine/threonine protein kinase
MAPERITGQSYTITSDVWSLGVTLLEVAQHRFPFPADGTEMQPRAGLIDLLTYIVRQPIPKLKDEPENGIRWSDNFKYFIECWYVSTDSITTRAFADHFRSAWKRNLLDERLLGGCRNIRGCRI